MRGFLGVRCASLAFIRLIAAGRLAKLKSEVEPHDFAPVGLRSQISLQTLIASSIAAWRKHNRR